MRRLISIQKASSILFSILGILILFHISVILKIVPATFIWGGNIEETSILPLELISIVATFCFFLFILIKLRYAKENRKSVFLNIVLWLISLFFLYNVFTNAFSSSTIEKIVFIPVALLLSFLTMRIAIE